MNFDACKGDNQFNGVFKHAVSVLSDKKSQHMFLASSGLRSLPTHLLSISLISYFSPETF